MAEQYKFPDEIMETGDKKTGADTSKGDLEVSVIDDTPPQDRGRQPLPKEMVKDLEDDNLEEYSEKVKQRINQARKAFHDERRAKESASREREEALSFARAQFEENKALKQRLGAGEKIFIKEVTEAATSGLSSAKDKLKAALESGDSDKIVEAQTMLNSAQLKLDGYSKFTPSSTEERDVVQSPTQARAPAPPQVDRKAESWRSKNTWFGQDEEMTALALGVHEKLVRSGVDPTSDDYYESIDKTMRKRFPDHYQDDSPPNSKSSEQRSERRNTTIVASASRSTAPRQVTLTASAAALAKRLGITPEAYAREKLKLESNNG